MRLRKPLKFYVCANGNNFYCECYNICKQSDMTLHTKERVFFVKKLTKVTSIILSFAMLMSMMIGMVSAEGLAPKNVRWATDADLNWNVDVSRQIVWDMVGDYTRYVVYTYKDGELVDSILAEYDDRDEIGYEDIEPFMESYGTGSYTVKVATYNGTWEDYRDYEGDDVYANTLGISEASVPYAYEGEARTTQTDTTVTTDVRNDGDSGSAAPVAETVKAPENTAPTEAAGAEIECPLAVKVCYDLSIMPNVYEDANKYVTHDALASIFENMTGTSYPLDKTDGNVTLLDAYKAFSVYTQAYYRFGTASNAAQRAHYASDIYIASSAAITHSQLAKLIYNVLNGKSYKADSWTSEGPQFSDDSEVPNGVLLNMGFVKYEGDVTVSGDLATVSGKLYDKEHLKGTDVKNVELNISDRELKTGSDYTLFVQDNTILSAVSASDAEKEAVTKNLTPPTVITLTIGSVNATVNGRAVTNDVAPMVVNDRTMLPIRFIAENLGVDVDWYSESRMVRVNSENREISVVIGDENATVTKFLEGIEYSPRATTTVALDSPAFIADGRTYLPVRFIAENLGADVTWNAESRTVTITKS